MENFLRKILDLFDKKPNLKMLNAPQEENNDMYHYKELFSEKIIYRGDAYYKAGKVDFVEEESPGVFYAGVEGDQGYQVKVEIQDNEIADLDCSCPYHLSNGDHCKHMYAVLRYMEENLYEPVDEELEPYRNSFSEMEPEEEEFVYQAPYQTNVIAEPTYEERMEENSCCVTGVDPLEYIRNHGGDLDNSEKEFGLPLPTPYKMIDKTVTVKIDHPIGSQAENGKFAYLTHFGHCEADEKLETQNLECYVLGAFDDMEAFTGKCRGLVRRVEDNHYILIVTPENKTYSYEQIQALTEYQERFYDSKIVM